jgi:uncharacterized protein YkwD
MAALTSARGLLAVAALALLWLVGASTSASGATRRTAHTSTCGHRTHARRCRNAKNDKRTARAPAAAPAATAPAPGAAGGCANAGLRPSAANLQVVAAAVLCLVNARRAGVGLAPLRSNAHLTATAQQHSDDMAGALFFNHVGSAGDTFAQRLSGSGYVSGGRTFTAGENIAWVAARLSTAAAMVADWIASADHRANILSPAFRDTGIGLSIAPPSRFVGGGRGTTVTEDFGVLR